MSGLVGTGLAYKQQSRELFKGAADMEQEREQTNDAIKQNKRATTASLAGTAAGIGFAAGGPVGALIGAGIGLLGDSLFG
jgi:hypothetical protein